ncbi:MAG: redoxin domain-containing protein [Armatimonadetes bacterium]|nr:redoxin domain-containing protein [Armatimonadota bacterium]
MIEPGTTPPGFALIDLEGRVHRSEESRASSLLVFFKQGCATCELSLPLFATLGSRLPGLDLLGICQEDSEEAAALARRLGLSFPVAPDPEPHPVSRSFELEYVPSWFALSAGEVLACGEGWSRQEFEELAHRLADSLGGVDSELRLDLEGVPDWRPG